MKPTLSDEERQFILEQLSESLPDKTDAEKIKAVQRVFGNLASPNLLSEITKFVLFLERK